MKKLFVIGNGFDVCHGLPSSYSYFLKYVQANNPDEYDRIGRMFGYGDPSYLWSEFEQNLGDFNVQHSIEANLEYQMRLAKEHPERALDPYTFLENACDTLVTDIRSLFMEWVQVTLSNKVVTPQMQLSVEDYYLNFNYTDILESTYSIPAANICYIHNKCVDGVTMPVFGHGLNKSVMDDLLSTEQVRIACERVAGADYDSVKSVYGCLLEDLRKKVETYICQNDDFFKKITECKYIYIIGHSIAPVDIPYFKKIASVLPGVPVVFSYLEEDKSESIKCCLSDVFGKDRVKAVHIDVLLKELSAK